MEFVLQVIGWIIVAIGVYAGVATAQQLGSFGVQNPVILATALGTAAGIVVVGILFLAFSTVIHLLRLIKDSAERSAALLDATATNTYITAGGKRA